MNYYGCTGSHNEFTCLSQYHQTTGRRKFRYSRWCPTCQSKYKNPDTVSGEEESNDRITEVINSINW